MKDEGHNISVFSNTMQPGSEPPKPKICNTNKAVINRALLKQLVNHRISPPLYHHHKAQQEVRARTRREWKNSGASNDQLSNSNL